MGRIFASSIWGLDLFSEARLIGIYFTVLLLRFVKLAIQNNCKICTQLLRSMNGENLSTLSIFYRVLFGNRMLSTQEALRDVPKDIKKADLRESPKVVHFCTSLQGFRFVNHENDGFISIGHQHNFSPLDMTDS